MKTYGTMPRLMMFAGLMLGAIVRAEAVPLRLGLAQAIETALTNNPDVIMALERIRAADATLMQANSAAWPKLQLQSAYTRTDNPMMVFGSILNQRAFGRPPIGPIDFNDVPDIDNLNVRGVATMPLYTGGQVRNARSAARAYVQATREQAEAVRQAIAFEVVRAYHTVLKTREFILAAEAAVAAFETNLQVAMRRFEAGTLLRTDVLDLEVRLAQAREDLIRARNANALATRALRTLLGLEHQDIELDADTPAIPVPVVAQPEPDRRPELAASRAQIMAAEAQLRQRRAERMPTLALFGSVDHDRGWRSDGEGTSYSAGVMLQWTLFDGQLVRGKIREAAAALDTARENDRKLRLALGLELEQARLNLAEATERLQVTQKALEKALQSAELSRARFDQGLALASQLIDAETALTAARVRLAEARADYQISVGALRRALGLSQLP